MVICFECVTSVICHSYVQDIKTKTVRKTNITISISGYMCSSVVSLDFVLTNSDMLRSI